MFFDVLCLRGMVFAIWWQRSVWHSMSHQVWETCATWRGVKTHRTGVEDLLRDVSLVNIGDLVHNMRIYNYVYTIHPEDVQEQTSRESFISLPCHAVFRGFWQLRLVLYRWRRPLCCSAQDNRHFCSWSLTLWPSRAKGMAGLKMLTRCMLFAAAMAANSDPLAQWLDSLKFSLQDVAWLSSDFLHKPTINHNIIINLYMIVDVRSQGVI